MKKRYQSLVYAVGDLVADPLTQTYGIVVEVRKSIDSYPRSFYYYRIEWQDQSLNVNHKYWNHYDICLIQSVNPNGKRETW